jgi:PIN domain
VQRLLKSLAIIPPTIADTVLAMRMHQQHGIQFFDALLMATALHAGCTYFLTEDMQDGRKYDGITVRPPPSPLASISPPLSCPRADTLHPSPQVVACLPCHKPPQIS